jgi:beta-xylosidase
LASLPHSSACRQAGTHTFFACTSGDPFLLLILYTLHNIPDAMKKLLTTLLMSMGLASVFAQSRLPEIKENVLLDSIRLSDPFILADKITATYYMTGTGGMLWRSKDLEKWTGPYIVTQTDPLSWMGPRPMIWAAELHQYKGKYYYFATFTNRNVNIDTVKGNIINRRASHVLMSENPAGPYVPMQDLVYLPADKPTLDGTFWVDKDGKT